MPAKWDTVGQLQSHRLSERVLERLEEMIRSGELQPTDKLPPERDLAEIFGVGRNSVREAIRQLALLGLVEARQGGGTFVTTPSAQSLVRPFRSVIEFAQAGPEQVIEFRRLFEPQVAYLAAERADPDAVEAVAAISKRFEASMKGEGEDPAILDAEFHGAIASAIGNPIIAAVQDALMDLLHTFRHEALLSESYIPEETAAAGHLRILEAIRDKRPELAAEAALDHLSMVEKYIVSRTRSQDEENPQGESSKS